MKSEIVFGGSVQVPDWNYRPMRPGDTTREPIQGEFFATEAITGGADALVREGIQNTLDARRNGQRVDVRIRISGPASAVEAGIAAAYLDGAWSHIHAKKNGLREPPTRSEPCTFLTFEDFGTTGLEGDPAQWQKQDGKNAFFAFFRAEGHSDKGETDRGRWGVGKTVFPRTSRASSFWGLTVRASDGRRLLMGRAILKTHRVQDVGYQPDGYFGRSSSDGLTLPIEDRGFIDQFCRTFGLHLANKPGLSLVVPWYDPEELTVEAVLWAVLRGYFYPILAGELAVTITGPDGRQQDLTADTLVDTVRGLNGQLANSLLSLLELAVWARDVSRDALPLLNRPPESGALRWQADLIPTEVGLQLRQKLQAGAKFAVRVPIPVREKGKPSLWSHLDIFAVHDGSDDRGRPVYIREGITISDVRGKTTRGLRALVVVEDPPLATLLGDSENPAHTQWQKGGSNYKGKYLFGPSNLEFVSNSVAEIVRLITESDQEADPSVLIDLFSLPAEPEAPDAVKTRQKKAQAKQKGPTPPEPFKPPPPQHKAYRVQKIVGGFRVVRGNKDLETPYRLDITVAYDIRDGNPFKKFHEADFRMIIGDDPEGVEVLSHAMNRVEVRVLQPDFCLSVTGFDENRDLKIDVKVREESDGD